eukprot:8816692-Alexandrium_andersonii.AAC.1
MQHPAGFCAFKPSWSCQHSEAGCLDNPCGVGPPLAYRQHHESTLESAVSGDSRRCSGSRKMSESIDLRMKLTELV